MYYDITRHYIETYENMLDSFLELKNKPGFSVEQRATIEQNIESLTKKIQSMRANEQECKECTTCKHNIAS